MSNLKPRGPSSSTGWGRMRSQVWIASVIGLVVLLLVGALILENRFGPIDPTDSGWKAKVVNDLDVPIDVKSSAVALKLAPGESDIFASPGPGQLNFILTITESHGRTLGCLVVRGNKRQTVQLMASQMTPCQS